MNSKDQKRKPTERDLDFVLSEVAMQRAANQARELARQKGSYVVVFRGGKVVKENIGKDVAY